MKPAAKKASSQNKNLIRHTSTISRANLLVFGLIFGAIGGYIIYQTLAASGTKVWDSQADFNSGSLSNVTANASGSVTLTPAVTYGVPAAVPACAGVNISPGANEDGSVIQTAVDTNPAGTTFCLAAGTYRLNSRLTLKNNDKFIGAAPNAIISGAKNITTQFATSGNYWVASNQTQNNPELNGIDQCEAGITNGACAYANDVYFDNQPMKRVMSLAELGTGKFFFDYGNKKIYIGSNPSGHKVEAGVTDMVYHGWQTSNSGIAFKYLIIEKFSNSAQTGVIQAADFIDYNELRYNHGMAIQGGNMGHNTGNYIHHNGEGGINPGWNMLIDNNEIAYNNYAGYGPGWEASGVKAAGGAPTHITMRANYVHDNDGVGLWCDTDCDNIIYEDNIVINNSADGILHEMNFGAIIRNNYLYGNGIVGYVNPGNGSTITGAGIDIANSDSTEVYGNTLVNNQSAVMISQSPRHQYCTTCIDHDNVHDNYVHDNNMTLMGGQQNGMVEYSSDQSYYTTHNNRFVHNTYLQKCNNNPFVWKNPSGINPNYTAQTWAQWQNNSGQDTTGTSTISSDCSVPAAQVPGGTYVSSGTVTLKYDAGSTSDWTTIIASESKPTGTNITYQYSSSADNNNWSMSTSDINAVPDNRYFQVVANLSTTNSSATPVINSITLSFNDPATGDIQLPTSPGNLNVTNKTQTTMTLNWTASTDNVGIQEYTLWRDSTWLGTVPANATSFTFGDGSGNQPTSNAVLTCGQTYNLKVAAYDTSYNMSTQVSVDASTNCAATIPGDANGDGHVSQGDLTILAANFGTSASFCDFNHDGSVNFLDVSIVLSNFGK